MQDRPVPQYNSAGWHHAKFCNRDVTGIHSGVTFSLRADSDTENVHKYLILQLQSGLVRNYRWRSLI